MMTTCACLGILLAIAISHPHPRLAAHRLSRKGDLRAHRLPPRAAAAVTGWAMCPRRTPERQPPTLNNPSEKNALLSATKALASTANASAKPTNHTAS